MEQLRLIFPRVLIFHPQLFPQEPGAVRRSVLDLVVLEILHHEPVVATQLKKKIRELLEKGKAQ